MQYTTLTLGSGARLLSLPLLGDPELAGGVGISWGRMGA
eukprot:CAMPEP_0183435022 /NCGR_PEP_ID=MMETSP0370-20130417/66036_1 /TAXON_ID=268820 /ORGANISM="Peridinium aciculiferum, Strain PAER-2" /LENGTH=38 /DNA_ID= /DNA_START= /DNA_END= /DNA_ORIENTATION=